MQYCRGSKKSKCFSPVSDFMEQIFIGELSGLDPVRLMKQGVKNGYWIALTTLNIAVSNRISTVFPSV